MSNTKGDAKKSTKASRRKRTVRIIQSAIAIIIALGMIITMFVVFLNN